MANQYYPSDFDVVAQLQTASLWPTDTGLQALIQDQAGTAIAESIQRFENGVGWLPFLSSGDGNETRFYDRISRNGHVMLDGGLLAASAISIHGSAFIQDTTFWLKPANAPSQGRPYTQIKFLPWLFQAWIWPIPNAVAITGEWGFSRTVPDDAWKAIVRDAAASVITGIKTDAYVSTTRQEDFEQSFNVSGDIRPQDIVRLWSAGLDRVIARYRCMGVG